MSNGERKIRVWVRPSTYRGRPGFHVYGTDWLGRHPRIFTLTREDAEVIRANIKAKRDPTGHWK